MKKFLKFLFIIPLFFLFFVSACGETKLESIKLSFEGATYSQGAYHVMKNKNILYTINAEIHPDNFTVDDFEWKSSNTDVARVFSNKVRTVGSGETTITATYKFPDGKEISASIKLVVTAISSEITFPSNILTNTYVYNGTDRKEDFKAIQDDGTGLYTYNYHSFSEKRDLEPDEALINAGSYLISCKKVGDDDIETSINVTIEKYKLSFTAGTRSMSYGDELPISVYNDKDIPENIFSTDVLGTDIYGVGRDASKIIGKAIDVTNATSTSDAKIGYYTTTVYFELIKGEDNDDIKKNYNESIDCTNGYFNIEKKNVVLVINDKTLQYGEKIPQNNYSLFSYEDYIADNAVISDKSNILKNERVNDYKNDIRLSSATYYEIDGTNRNIANVNSVGYLNVLEGDKYYELDYPGANSPKNNLAIKVKLTGKIQVNKRAIEVLPLRNQKKVYAEPDPTNFGYYVTSNDNFVNNDVINNFLYVKYGSDIESNLWADAGSYYFDVDNSKNQNYNITLNSDAVYAEGTDESSKVRFEVIPRPIFVQFNDVKQNYKPTFSSGSDFANYYGNPEFKLSIKSLKINNVEYANNGAVDSEIMAENFEDRDEGGKFKILSQGNLFGYFYFTISTSSVDDPELTYSISSTIGYDDISKETNFEFNFDDSSKIILSKIQLILTPTTDEALFSKIYDGSNDTHKSKFGYAKTTEQTDCYFDLVGDEVSITSIYSVSNEPVLTLKNKDNKYVKVLNDGKEVLCDDMKSVGRYKIFMIDLDSKPPITGSEYYSISFDNSKNYYYTVLKREVTIIPDSDQSKVYGSYEPKIFYTVDNLTDKIIVESDVSGYPVSIGGTIITGSLNRASGENVGSYLIGRGNINFGENFIINFSTIPVNFSITIRQINVTPSIYDTTYGDPFPTKMAYSYQIIDAEDIDYDLLDLPRFTGNFALGLSNGSGGYFMAEKIGSYYPVNLVGESVEPYYILQNDFRCTSNNYSIIFTEGVTYKIGKRPAVINIIDVDQIENEPNSTVILDESKYEISNLINDYTNKSLRLRITKVSGEDNQSTIYIVENGNFEVSILRGVKELSNNYNFSFGKNIVYRIGTKMIYLNLVSTTSSSSICDCVYNATSHSKKSEEKGAYVGTDDFYLVCETDGYVLDKDTDFTLKFEKISGTGASAVSGDGKPKNVGSYIARIDTSENVKIVLEKTNVHHTCDGDCEYYEGGYCKEKYVVFDSLVEGKIVGDCALSISGIGYLNILKADITYDSSKISFEDKMTYGSSKLLSNLATTFKTTPTSTETKPIFKGQGDDVITLKPFEYYDPIEDETYYLNFKYSTQTYNSALLKSYNVGSNNIISLTIEDGGENGNYNPLTLSVPIEIKPAYIEYTKVYFSRVGGSNYDGNAKTIEYTIKNGSDILDLKGEYKGIIAEERDDIRYITRFVGKTMEFAYYPVSGRNVITTGEVQWTSSFSTKTASFSGNYLILTDANIALIQADDQINNKLKDAGFYVSSFTITTDNNHKFLEKDLESGTQEEKENGIFFFVTYQINRFNDFDVTNWQEEYFYTEEFNFNTGYPFKKEIENGEDTITEYFYTISPNLIDKVKYSLQLNGEDVTPEGTDNLPPNEEGEYYEVVLTIDETNYYYAGKQKLKIKPLIAQVITPNVSTYVYDGKQIKYFLNQIGVTVETPSGEPETIYYDPDSSSSDFVLVFKQMNSDGEYEDFEGVGVPINVGQYKIEISYNKKDISNRLYYSGSAEYEYSIMKKGYKGTISFDHSEITYDPAWTPTNLYNYIVSNMFTIGSGLSYEVKSLFATTGGSDIEISSDMSSEDFNIVYYYGAKALTIVIDFNDDVTEDWSDSALLTISKRPLSSADFTFKSDNFSYSYNGYNIYNEIEFKGQKLASSTPINCIDGAYEYTIFALNRVGNEFETRITDKLGNQMISIKYSYQKFNNTIEKYEDFVDKDGNSYAPIEPGKYSVKYQYTMGENYINNDVLFKNLKFVINKTDLFISFLSNFEKDYDTNPITESAIKDRLKVRNNSTIDYTNMKYKLFESISADTVYDFKEGVYILVQYDKYIPETESYTKVNSIIDAGNYRVNISLAYLGDYDISKYFNSINLDGNTYSIASYISTLSSDKYDCLTRQIIVNEIEKDFTSDIKFNTGTTTYYASQLFAKEIGAGGVEVTKKIEVDGTKYEYLVLYKDYSIVIENSDILVKSKVQSGATFEYLEDMSTNKNFKAYDATIFEEGSGSIYLYMFEISQVNYKKSYILFVVLPLSAEIDTPTITTYEHTGEEITSFLSEINASFITDTGEIETVYYDPNESNSDFILNFKQLNSSNEYEDLEEGSIPIEVGQYKIEILYKKKILDKLYYYGKAEFVYSIV